MSSAAEPMKLELRWEHGLQFEAVTARGHTLSLDGDAQAGASPMETLLAALCSCMGSDVVDILRKMRFDLRQLTISASGERNPVPPRFFRRIELAFTLTGNVPRERAEHAVQLSFDRYCSVFHSLRKDMEISRTIVL